MERERGERKACRKETRGSGVFFGILENEGEPSQRYLTNVVQNRERAGETHFARDTYKNLRKGRLYIPQNNLGGLGEGGERTTNIIGQSRCKKKLFFISGENRNLKSKKLQARGKRRQGIQGRGTSTGKVLKNSSRNERFTRAGEVIRATPYFHASFKKKWKEDFFRPTESFSPITRLKKS